SRRNAARVRVSKRALTTGVQPTRCGADAGLGAAGPGSAKAIDDPSSAWPVRLPDAPPEPARRYGRTHFVRPYFVGPYFVAAPGCRDERDVARNAMSQGLRCRKDCDVATRMSQRQS
ncbi:hypothetical protein, partial [Rhodovulum sp. PH10]|uniref:hypothetical protein n=1 Tax=Rhodovulum sp. PH10 TaxID=1187851 RepID=UPI001ED8CF1A